MIILFFLWAAPAKTQWNIVAPNMLGKQDFGMGAITHKAGITWAGSYEVFMSPDSGITWTKRWTENLGKDNIQDINFYDNKIGLVCTHFGSVFRTDDQGISWREIHRAPSAYSATFLGSPDNIIVVTGVGGTIEVTRDGGLTWVSQLQGNFLPQIRPLLGGSAMALSGSKVPGLNIIKTTDYGTTWQPMSGKIDFDSYSFEVNPCDPRFIYAIHEEGTTVTNNLSEIFASTDAGNSWQVSQSFPIDRQASKFYFSGSVSLTTKAVFVQTVSEGIRRSTDQGTNWKSIGGPSATFDTRLICAINSNIVLAADNNGTIWRTFNSGGDTLANISPFESLALSPTELFNEDSLARCDSPVVEFIHLRALLCKYPKILDQKIIGKDSLDYTILIPLGDSLTGDDSVLISFRPHSSGEQRGEYVITLEDGTQVSVPLKGFGKSIHFVEPMTQDIAVDTIGGYAQVPIRFSGFVQKENIEVVLHYDSRMIYNGSISLAGTSLDIPNEAWGSRAKLRIPKNEMRLDTISGYAIFTIYPDGNDCFEVSIDSMNILNPFAPCTYSIGNPVTANICPPKGCGVMTITNYILHGILPQLTVYPNPSQNSAFIKSNASLGDVEYEIVDLLGRTYQRNTISLKKDTPAKLEMENLRTGIYYIRVKTNSTQYQLRVMIMK
jgi:photosystem II stability/assembly factor-like uncharacterized protein